MTKPRTKSEDGLYHINGKMYKMLTGSKAQVYHKTAHETTGGLTAKDIIQNKHGRIVSLSKHKSAKKEKRLLKAGYGTEKGKFGCINLITKKRCKTGTKRKTKKRGTTTKRKRRVKK